MGPRKVFGHDGQQALRLRFTTLEEFARYAGGLDTAVRNFRTDSVPNWPHNTKAVSRELFQNRLHYGSVRRGRKKKTVRSVPSKATRASSCHDEGLCRP